MKYIYYLIAAILILFILFSFFNSNSNSRKNSFQDQDGFARGTVDSNRNKSKNRSRDRSLFEEDSKFLEFNDAGFDEMDSQELTQAERERRRKIVIEKTKKLAALFPHNSIIPRELSQEEAKKIAETNLKMATIQNSFLQNEKVTKEDKIFYYKERFKISKDRLEIFRYVLGLQNSGVFEESKLDGVLKERYEVLLENEKAYSDEIGKVEKE